MFNIKSVVSKITGRDSQPNSPGPRLADVSSVFSDEDGTGSNFHSAEGFICPKCMKALPSPEDLQNHYVTVHGGEGDITPDSPASNSGAGFLGLHQEVGEHYKQQRQNGSAINQDRLFAEIQGITDVGELRKSLLDALESKAELQLEKETLEQRTAQLARVNAAMLAKADEDQGIHAAVNERLKIVETQLAHRDSVDDAAVLRQQIVFVQHAMDQMTQERECEVVALREELARAHEHGTADTEQLRDQLAKACSQLERVRADNASQVESVRLEVAAVEAAGDEARAACDAAEERFSACRNDYEAERAKAVDLLRQLQTSQDETERLQKGVRIYEEKLSAANEKLLSNNKMLVQQTSEIAAIKHELEKLHVESSRNKGIIAEQNALLSTKDEKTASLKADVARLNELIGSSGASKAVIDQLILENEALQKAIDECGNELEMSNVNMNAMKDEMADVRHAYESRLQNTVDAQLLLDQQLATIKAQLIAMSSELNESEETVKRLSSELDVARNELVTATQQVSELTSHIDSSQQVLKIKDEKMVDLEKKVLNYYLPLEGKLDQAREEVKVLGSKLVEAEENMQGMEVKKASLETSLFEYEKQLAEAEKLKRDVQQTADSEIESLRESIKVMKISLVAEEEANTALKGELSIRDTQMKDENIKATKLHLEDTAEIKLLNKTISDLKSAFAAKETELCVLKADFETLKALQEKTQENSTGEILALKEDILTMEQKLKITADRYEMRSVEQAKVLAQTIEAACNADSKYNEMIAQVKEEAAENVLEVESKLKGAESALKDLKTAKEEYQEQTQVAIDILQEAIKGHEIELVAAKEKIAEYEDQKSVIQSKLVDMEKEKAKVQALLDVTCIENKKMLTEVQTSSIALDAANKELEAEREVNHQHQAAEEERIAVSNQKYAELNSSYDEVAGEKLALDALLATSQSDHKTLMERYYQLSLSSDSLHTTVDELRRRAEDSQSALLEMGRENQILRLELEKNSGRKWTEDSDVTNCPTCRKEFSLITRKHHCRNCGQIFCNECSSKCAAVGKNKKPVRVCESCFNELAPPQ